MMDSLKTHLAAAPVNPVEAPSWTVDTNWTIAGGSFSDTVIIESSFCPLDDADNCEAKSPLILCPNSSESVPPAITVKFSQKQEIRQVYLRSTARVYEVYYTEKHGSCNEYLSTIRCGPATRDGSVLQAFNFDDTSTPHQSNPRKQPNKDEQKKMSRNEETWVEVIVTEHSLSSQSSSLFLDECDEPISKTPQDFHDASAEIDDMNPCMSVTFKLLSLGNKSCVCVDELYVFADPVSEQSSENPDENRSKDSLMTMILPAIMQLSSSRKETPIAEETNMIKPIVVDPPKECDSSSSSVNKDTKSNESEALLNQIITRISRVEEHLLRFQESVLMPIKSIDERLGRVEKQLESLSKKPPSRVYVSCDEPEANTLQNSEEPELKNTSSGETREEPVEVSNGGETSEESAKEAVEQRRHVSIDDALASALAGLMMSPSAVPVVGSDEEQRPIESTLRREELKDATENDSNDSVESSVPEVTFLPSDKVNLKATIDELLIGSSEAVKDEERIDTNFGEFNETLSTEEWEYQSASETRDGGNENACWIMEESLI